MHNSIYALRLLISPQVIFIFLGDIEILNPLFISLFNL